MKQELSAYIDALFRDAALSVRNAELKEEILQNTLDKYDDLLAAGNTPQRAYQIAIDGIGDISGLIEPYYIPPQPPAVCDTPLPPDAPGDGFDWQKKRLRGAKLAIWLSFVVVYFLWSVFSHAWYISWVIFLLASCATELLTALFYWNVPEQHKRVRGGCIGAMWSLMLTMYFVISFQTGSWNITWLMFLIGAALSAMLKACFDLREVIR